MVSCGDAQITVGLSKGSGSENYLKYAQWLQASDPLVEVIDLYELEQDEALDLFSTCDALLLTGGGDLDPSYYGKLADETCFEIDPKRDLLEFALIERALSRGIPIFGVCRGLQILNVALGGTLIVDLSKEFGEIIHRDNTSFEDTYHRIIVLENTLLSDVTNSEHFLVNSRHHQAIDKLSQHLRATAYTSDGIVEAIEWQNAPNDSFLIAVQWHPERLDHSSSQALAEAFLVSIKKNDN